MRVKMLATAILLVGLAGVSETAEASEKHPSAELKPLKHLVKHTADTAKKTVGQTVQTVTGTVESTVGQVTKGVDKTTGHVTETVKAVNGTVTETVRATTGELAKAPVLQPVTKTVHQTVTATTVSVDQVVADTTETVEKTVQTVTRTAEKATGGAGQLVNESLPPVKDKPPVKENAPVKEVNEPATAGKDKLEDDQPDGEAEQPDADHPVPPVHAEKPAELPAPAAQAATVQKPVGDMKAELPVTASPENLAEQPSVAVSEPVQRTKAEQNAKPLPVAPIKDAFKTASSAKADVYLNAQATIAVSLEPAAQPKQETSPNLKDWQIANLVQAPNQPQQSHTAVSGNAQWGGTAALLWNSQITAEQLSSKWSSQNDGLKNQWTHAPPGQPPQVSPFLLNS